MMDNQPYSFHPDLAYTPNGEVRQRLDLYLPLRGGPFPLLIWFHGGGFSRGSKAPGPKNQVPLTYVEKGFAVAAVGYRLSPDARFPAAIHDAKRAVGWLRQQASLYGLDPARFTAWGHSAGAYLSTMVGLTGWCPQWLGENYAPLSTQVSAVIAESAPINFLSMDAQKPADGLPHNPADSAESVFMGAPIQTIPERVNMANPTHYLNPAFVPRFLVFHGDADKHVPYLQSVELVNALQKAGAAIDFHRLPNVGHFDIDRSAIEDVIDAFLGQK